MFKKSVLFISVGIFNFLHGITHLIQFIQSALLFSGSLGEHGEHGWTEELLHNPFFSLLWAIIGIVTLIIGVKDFKHHKKCESHSHD